MIAVAAAIPIRMGMSGVLMPFAAIVRVTMMRVLRRVVLLSERHADSPCHRSYALKRNS